MKTIIMKEFRELLYNPKFLLTFTVSTVLILISIFNGYTAYEGERKSAVLGSEVALKDAQAMNGYNAIERQGLRVSREPEKMSIFNQGISGVIGRKSLVRSGERPRARDSRYSLDPVLAVFGELDLTFTVGLILALFALLFSYNAFSGERESGTLRLMMANSVGRSTLVLGKLVGGFLPLALLFMIPFMLGLAGLMMLTGINFTADEWLRIAMMGLASLLYLLVFYSIGLAMSALTRNSFVSFLLCLFVWVLSVVAVPRIVVQAAAQISPSMSIDQVESRILAYKNDRRDEWSRRMSEYLKNHELEMDKINEVLQVQGKRIRQEIAAEDEKFQDSLFAEYGRRRDELLRTASNFSRISPTSNFSFAMNTLSNTGPKMLERFEEDLQFYRRGLVDYMQQKQEEEEKKGKGGAMRGIRVMKRGDGKVNIILAGSEATGKLDLSNMPRFSATDYKLANAVGETIPDYALLALYAIGFFALAFVAFLRYDVR